MDAPVLSSLTEKRTTRRGRWLLLTVVLLVPAGVFSCFYSVVRQARIAALRVSDR